ncbi:MAG: helix-turn-helix domain-containing protein [bacterium]|jgi:hypothetical protein
MSLLDTIPLAQIEERHLVLLIEHGVGEGPDIEFKQASYSSSDDDKREFLKDVTALANTSGGHIVIGMVANGGIASSFSPLGSSIADSEKQRLENMLLDSVEPRLVGVQIREVAVDGGILLILRVPRSWSPPHRVTFKRLNKYFLRHSAGVYEPSVDQLRAVFLGGADTERRLLEFRIDRIARLQSGEKGVALHAPGQMLLQAVPLGGSQPGFVMPSIQDAMNAFAPPGNPGATYRFNLDGLLIQSSASHGPGRTTSYTQIFRDGRIEMARGGYVRDVDRNGTLRRAVASGSLVIQLASAARRSVEGIRRRGVTDPLAILISFLDAAGSRLPPPNDFADASDELDRRDILFAPMVIEADYPANDQALEPILDALWQAYGNEHCYPARDREGQWRGLSAFRD